MRNWQAFALVSAAIWAGSIVTITRFWVEIPAHWQPSYFIGIPIFASILTYFLFYLHETMKRRRDLEKEPEELEKLTIAIEYIDREWHDSLDLMSKLIEEGRKLFSKINHELHEEIGDEVAGDGWRYKGVSEITAESLRISDSVLCQLWTGHPDTALGTTRQLFELMIFQKVIALDLSGKTAQRYQDFSEMRFLQQSIESGNADKKGSGERLGEIKQRYPKGTNFKPPFAWIKLPNGNHPNDMEYVISYIVSQVYDDPADRPNAHDFYLRQWVKLNGWTHISKPASRRKLGLRADGGTMQMHLLEKSRVGLDTPLSMSVFYLRAIIDTLEETALDLTHKSHSGDTGNILNKELEISKALDSVPRELLANDFRMKFSDGVEANRE